MSCSSYGQWVSTHVTIQVRGGAIHPWPLSPLPTVELNSRRVDFARFSESLNAEFLVWTTDGNRHSTTKRIKKFPDFLVVTNLTFFSSASSFQVFLARSFDKIYFYPHRCRPQNILHRKTGIGCTCEDRITLLLHKKTKMCPQTKQNKRV